jgi:predicted transcriptional regulator of viral defense system
LGEAAIVRRSDERTEIIDAITKQGEPMTPSEVAGAIGKQRNNVKQFLFQMAVKGEVFRVSKGKYWLTPSYGPNPTNHTNRLEDVPGYSVSGVSGGETAP